MMLVRPTWMVMLLTSFGAMVALGAIPGSASALSSGVGDKTLHLLAYGFMHPVFERRDGAALDQPISRTPDQRGAHQRMIRQRNLQTQ